MFLLTPTVQVVSYADEKRLEDAKEEVRNNPDDADAHYHLGIIYCGLDDRGSAMEQYKILKKLDTEKANELFNKIYK